MQTITLEPLDSAQNSEQTLLEIEPLIQSVGATVLYQSPYSPDFNPIEHW